MAVEFADFNRDGRLDLVTTRNGTQSADFYWNTGERDSNGCPHLQTADENKSVQPNFYRVACRKNRGSTEASMPNAYECNDPIVLTG